MPTLDDLRSRTFLSGTPESDDLIPYFDVAEHGNAPVKKASVASLRESLRVPFDPDSVVVVASASADTARGEALRSAYAAAKLLTPGG